MGVFALLWLFEGSRRLASNGIEKAAVSMLAVGLVLSIALSGVAYVKYRMVSRVIETQSQPVLATFVPLPDDWGGKCCKSTLEPESRKLVQGAFVESGQLHTYFDSTGQRIAFTPTEKDLREREERVVSNARIGDSAQARLSEAMYAAVAALLSLLFGAGIGYEQRKSSANNTAESGARKSGARGSP